MATDILGGISKNNEIPWRCKKDKHIFQKKTVNNIVIMGNNTYLSLPEKNKPLKNRLNIVFTNNPECYTNLHNLIYVKNNDIIMDITNNRDKYTKLYPFLNKEFKIFIIGGKQIYDKYVLNCDIFWISYIKNNYECDILFDMNMVNDYFHIDTIIHDDDTVKIIKYIKN